MRTLSLIVATLAFIGCHGNSNSEPVKEAVPMILTLSSGEEIRNPSPKQIRDALLSLDVSRDGEGFAILAHARNNMTYIQASGDCKIGFDLEYQEGATDRHFRAEREDFAAEEVKDAFTAYADGSIDWSEHGEWKRIEW